jgi:hypothetical protein
LLGPSPSSLHSAAVVTAISLYMRHLGVRTKSGDKKSGRNFFRKKVLKPNLAFASSGTPHPRGSLLTGDLGSDSAVYHLGNIKFPFLPTLPQVMGNRRSDEPPKTKKGLSSILDAARWNRAEPPGTVALTSGVLDSALPSSPSCPHLTVPFCCFSSRFSTPQKRG